MTEFKELIIEGYKSIEFEIIDFESLHPITLIKGKTGSGKTSIIEALFWCLYGGSLKDLPASKIKSKYIKSGTKVALTLIIGNNSILIIRTHAYKEAEEYPQSGVYLEINGEVYQDEKNSDINKKIESLLGVPVNLFINSVLFPQRMIKLAEHQNKDIKKLLDVILDRVYKKNFIEPLYERAVTRKEAVVIKHNKALAKVEKLNQQRMLKLNDLKNHKQVLENHQTNQELRAEKLRAKIKEKKQEIPKGLKDLSGKIAIAKKKINKAKIVFVNSTAELTNTKEENETWKKKVKELSKEVDLGNCHACNQKILIDDSKLNKLKVAKQNQERTAEELNILINKSDKASNKYNKAGYRVDNLEAEQVEYNKSNSTRAAVKELEVVLKGILNEKPPENKEKELLLEIGALEGEMTGYTIIADKLSKDLEGYDWCIKNALGAGGVRTYLFNSILQNINEKLLPYTQPFGLTVYLKMVGKVRKSLEINIEKDNTKFDYKELSGGEKSQIDVSFGFSLHDLTNKSQFNVLIFDESIDGLDAECTAKAFELIRMKSKTAKVLLISHSEHLPFGEINIMKVKKTNKITKIVA